MLRAIVLSTALHVTIFLLFVFTPTFWGKSDLLEEQLMVVELVSIKDISNSKQSSVQVEESKKDEPKAVPKKTPLPAPKEIKKPANLTSKLNDKAEYLPEKDRKKNKELPDKVKLKEKPEIPKVANVRPQVKPRPPVRNVETKKNPVRDFTSVLSSVDEISKKYEAEQKKHDEQEQESRFDVSKPLSMTVIDSIRKQVGDYWNIDGGARYAENIVVKLHIILEIDGTVVTVNIVDKGRYASDSFYKAAADRARTAVYRVGRFKKLPSESYKQWRDINLTFDPRNMFN